MVEITDTLPQHQTFPRPHSLVKRGVLPISEADERGKILTDQRTRSKTLQLLR
jgi:hypothetical protein